MHKHKVDTSSSSATNSDLHPFGMLDRDQRTIFTFSSMKLTNTDQQYNFNKKSSKQSHRNKWIACDNSSSTSTTSAATEHLCDKKICCTINNTINIHRNTNTRSHQMHCYHSSSSVDHQRQHQCCRTQRQTIKLLRTSKSPPIASITFKYWNSLIPCLFFTRCSFYELFCAFRFRRK